MTCSYLQNANYAHSLANSIALALPSGKAASTADSALEYVLISIHCRVMHAELKNRKLQTIAPSHPLLLDLQEKSDLFDEAASKFQVQVA